MNDGPHSATVVNRPEVATGEALLSAPQAASTALGLWLYSPSERRTRELSPQDPNDHLLETDFDYVSVSLAARPVRSANVISSEVIDDRQA